MAEPLKVTSARERRGASTYLFKVSPKLTVRMRRLDITTMVLQNLIPFNLLKAANKFEEMARNLATVAPTVLDSEGNGGEDAINELEKIDPGQLQDMMEFLRHYAIVIIAEPKITMEDDGNPDHLPVSELDGDELMAIFYSRPPEGMGKEPTQLTVAEAEEFRRPEPTVADSSVPDGEAVRAEAKLVDTPEREFIYG